jgi:hypothetical protein
MFIANPKRTFAEVRGLNSPAGATMVPAVPLSPLTIRKIRSPGDNRERGGKCSYGGVCSHGSRLMPLKYGQFARFRRWFVSYLRP